MDSILKVLQEIAIFLDGRQTCFFISFLNGLYDLIFRMGVGMEFQVSGPRYFSGCFVNSIRQKRGKSLD